MVADLTPAGLNVTDAAFADAAERIEDRFFTYRQNRELQGEAEEIIDLIRAHVQDLAVLIELKVPNGRNKAIALTALEDTQIRAIRGLFEYAPPAPVAAPDPEKEVDRG